MHEARTFKSKKKKYMMHVNLKVTLEAEILCFISAFNRKKTTFREYFFRWIHYDVVDSGHYLF